MNELDPSYAGDGIYREHIIDHYKNPRNTGSLSDPTISHKEFNPVCGDEITFSVKVGNGVVEEARFQGKGCAISQAAASMFSEQLKGKTLQEIKSTERENIIEMIGIPVGPVRIKCAMLGLVALKNGISRFERSQNG